MENYVVVDRKSVESINGHECRALSFDGRELTPGFTGILRHRRLDIIR